MSAKPYKIAVAGTHSTGKTTFLSTLKDELEALGDRVAYVHDSAVNARELGFPILGDHTFESTAWLMGRAIELEVAASLTADVILVDRPVPDALGYLIAALRHTGRSLEVGRIERLEAMCLAWAGDYDLLFLTRLDSSVPLGPGRDPDLNFRVAAATAVTEVVNRMFTEWHLIERGNVEAALLLAHDAIARSRDNG